MEPPDRVAVPRVEGPRAAGADFHAPEPANAAAAARREVDEPGEHRRGARDRGRRAEAPPNLARASVECDEVAVPGTHEDGVSPDRRGGVDVRPHLPRPQEVSAPGAEGVDRPVGVSDEDPPVRDRGRGVEVLAPAEVGERPCAPAHPPGERVNRVNASAARRDKHDVLRVCGRGHDLVVGSERPAQAGLALAPQGIGVEAVVPRPEVEPLADDDRGRLDRPRLDSPELAAVPRVPGDHEPARAACVLPARERVHEGLVDDPVANRR